MTTRPLARVARAAGLVTLAALVAGVAALAGLTFSLVLLARGLVVPAALVALAYLVAYLVLRGRILDSSSRRPAPAPPVELEPATIPLTVVMPAPVYPRRQRAGLTLASGA